MENKKNDELKDLELTEVSGGINRKVPIKDVEHMSALPELMKKEHESLTNNALHKEAGKSALKKYRVIESGLALKGITKKYPNGFEVTVDTIDD
ncbi:MAG: hypothetical protein Q4E33_05200 [Erysipelotrichaceae bacterium]|nr:hypothetical protein [Erysipelotrichaceae bacterium]